MQTLKKCIATMLIGAVTLSFTSCGKSVTVKEETPYYSTTIDGEKKYYSEEETKVEEVSTLGKDFATAICGADYNDLSKPFSYDYFTKEIQSYQDEAAFRKSEADYISEYELLIELSGFDVKMMKFSKFKNVESVTMEAEIITIVKHGVDAYLEQSSVKLNTPYRRTLTIEASVEDGEWKVSNYDVTSREEVK